MNYTASYLNDIDTAISAINCKEKLFNRNILITGGSGMICSPVIDILFALNKKYDAHITIRIAGRNRERIVKRFAPFKCGTDFEFIRFDATMDVSLDTATDYIIYGASNADPVSINQYPAETILTNIIGLLSILKYSFEKKIKRLLYISSGEIYGIKNNGEPYREDDYGYIDVLNARACYPCSKRAAENLCISYTKEYAVDTVIVRPGHIYGPTITETDSRASAQFTRNALAKKDIVMKSGGEQLRSYCYVMDCASALLTVLLAGKTGNAYNIANPNSTVTVRRLAQEFADASGTKIIFQNATDAEKKSYNLMENSSLDSTKLEALGWKPRFSLKDGVSRTLEILQENGN